MTQEAVQITTTPPLPGLQLVQDMNKALETIATDFAGSTDPAAMAWPYSTWADTGTGSIKRRNAANSAWVIEGRLLRAHLPMYAPADVPALDIGPIYIIGKGPAEWDTSAYKVLVPDFPSDDDLQWLGQPIGMPFPIVAGASVPPTDNPAFRYVLLTAGQTGAGGYNEGVLTSETVTGTSPLIEATATVNLAGSPMDGQTIHLINTEERFIGAAEAERVQDDALQDITGSISNVFVSATPTTTGAITRSALNPAVQGSDIRAIYYTTVSIDAGLVARVASYTRPRSLMLPHYMRIL